MESRQTSPVPVVPLAYEPDGGGTAAESLAAVVRGVTRAVVCYDGLALAGYAFHLGCFRWQSATVPAGRRMIDGVILAAGVPSAVALLVMFVAAVRSLRWADAGRRWVVWAAAVEMVVSPLTYAGLAVYTHHTYRYAAYGSAYVAYAAGLSVTQALGSAAVMAGLCLFYRFPGVRRLFTPN